MDSRIDFEKLAKQLKDENFDDVFETINSEYVGKSFEEVVDLLSNIDNITLNEKLNAFAEKYDDDLLDLQDEFKEVEAEYQVKIDEAIAEQEAASRRRINHIKDYNDYNNEIENDIGPFVEDNISVQLMKVEEELKLIERKEELLNGNLSKRMARRKEELVSEKENLLKDQSDLKDLREESRYLAKEEEKNIKNAQDKRNEIIGELAKKKVELFKEKGSLRKNSKKYNYLISEVNKAAFAKKMAIDKEFNSIKEEFESKIASGDLNAIAEYSAKYLEISNKKIAFDNKFNELLKIFGIDSEVIDIILQENAPLLDAQAGVEPQTETTFEQEPIVDNKQEELSMEEEPILEEVKPGEIQALDEEPAAEYIPLDELTAEELPEVENELEELATEPVQNSEVEEIPLETTEEVMNIPDQEPTLPEKIIMNKKCLDNIGVQCQQIDAMYPNEKPLDVQKKIIALNRLTNIIHLTNSDLLDHIIDENSLIRTSHNNYISTDLIDEYNETVDELEKLETQKNSQSEPIVEQPVPVVGNEMVQSENTSLMGRFSNLKDDDEDEEELENPEFEEENQESPILDDEGYGFQQLPMYQEIQPQSTEPVNLSDVMVEETTAPEVSPSVLDEDEEEPELEFLPLSQPVVNTTPQPEPIPANEVIDSAVEEPVVETPEVESTIQAPVGEQPEQVSTEEKKSGGLFKGLFGKKAKEESEHEIKSVVDASESLIEKISDKLHKFMLDAEGYATWKRSQEEKQRGM